MKEILDDKAFQWVRGESAKALVRILGDRNCRFVGGAVRDSLLGREVHDIDVATTLPPEEVVERLKHADIRAVPTGIKHGTVTAVFPMRSFEITTLRHDVETYGRHAEVAFHDNWEADAARRDFTMNALYLSPSRKLFDYFGGKADLKAGRVRFIGDAGTRIEEDALRILRLFRFHAWFGKGQVDAKGLAAVKKRLDMLDILSPERIQKELFKLLTAPAPLPALRTMEKVGVLSHVFRDFRFDFEKLDTLVGVENRLGRVSALRRLGTFIKLDREGAETLFHRLHLSNHDRDRLIDMISVPLPVPLTERAARRDIYENGKEAFEDRVLTAGAPNPKDWLLLAKKFKLPKFPVTGRDLEKRGIEPGIAMGKILKTLETRWVESDFKVHKEELLKVLS